MDGARAFIGKRHVYHKHGIVLWGPGYVGKQGPGRQGTTSLAGLAHLSIRHSWCCVRWTEPNPDLLSQRYLDCHRLALSLIL